MRSGIKVAIICLLLTFGASLSAQVNDQQRYMEDWLALQHQLADKGRENGAEPDNPRAVLIRQQKADLMITWNRFVAAAQKCVNGATNDVVDTKACRDADSSWRELQKHPAWPLKTNKK